MHSFAGRTEANRARAASVDVLFMYTPQAFEAVGGSVDGLANIRSQINSAVAATNNAYLQSDANMRINVAGIEAVPGTQQDTCVPPALICQSPQYGQAVLLDLANTESNVAIATRRDELSADIVVLIIENGGGAGPPNQAIILCGVANQMRELTLGPAFAPKPCALA